MAEKYGLFNSSIEQPREYNDTDLAEMFSLFTGGQGYVAGIGGELEVSSLTDLPGLYISVASGAAWLGDPAGWWYKSDESKTLEIRPQTAENNRIDRVVLRMDRNNDKLSVEIAVVEGGEAPIPDITDLTQGEMIYEISLAQLYIEGGTNTVTITDERNTEYCGKLHLSIDGDNYFKNPVVLDDTDNPNDTIKPILLSKNSTGNPRGMESYFYYMTLFYSAVSNTNSRVQLAYGYNFKGTYIRYYYQQWSDWQRLDSDTVIKTVAFTLALIDMNCYLRVNSATDINVTIPAESSIDFPISTEITFEQTNTGQITLVADTGVIIRSLNSNKKSDGQYSVFTIRKVASDVWTAVGALTS